MALDLKNLSGNNIEQLALQLNIEETEVDASISPAEAQRRSEVALAILKNKFKADIDVIENYKKSMKSADLETPMVFPDHPTNLYGWAEDFYRLLDGGWPWRVAVYIAWAGSPKIDRWPKTQEDLALQVLGLNSDRQISEWRKKNPAIDEMIGLMQAMPMLSYRRDIFEALAASASNHSSKGAQDRKTALTMTGDYVPHQKVEIERPKLEPKDLSEEELRKAVEDERFK